MQLVVKPFASWRETFEISTTRKRRVKKLFVSSSSDKLSKRRKTPIFELALQRWKRSRTQRWTNLRKNGRREEKNVNRDKNATISKSEKELFDERVKLEFAEGRDVEFATLQQELAAERAKSKRLEEKLGPFLLAAVATGSL
jgi:hypothetical protein